MDKTLFAQALTTTPHLSLGGHFGMEYKHLSRCFILEDPSSGFSKLFQVIVIIVRKGNPRSMALMMGANRLLVMAKDIRGFRLIVVSEMFFNLLIAPLSYSFESPFKSTDPPISL
jgi:hypothetical protein